MKKLITFFACCLMFSLAVTAQKKVKPWTEWSEKDAQKMLDDSPWGQVQTEANTSEMFFSPTTSGGARSSGGGGIGDSNDRGSQGALNQAVTVNFRIRFLSAKPIRRAFARRLILQNPQAEAQLKAFAEQKSADWVVVAVDFDASDKRFTGQVMQAFNTATIGTLANNTYLETKDGKRVFIKDYKAPISDGMGAKFIFPRIVDEQPFVKRDDGYVRFYSEVRKDIKLNMRFKVPEMLYEGTLEY